MNATAHLVAAPGGRIRRLRSEPPLTLLPTPGAVYLVGSAAGPLGGDALRIEIDVEEDASLTVRSAAASVALPGPSSSSITVHARVGAGGSLRWLVEPTVAASGCSHRMRATVTLAERASLEWREEIVLGRHGELGGSVSSWLSVDVAEVALVRQHLALGCDHPASATPAVIALARAVGTVTLAGTCVAMPQQAIVFGGQAAVLPLDGPGYQVLAFAGEHSTVRRLLEEGVGRAAASATPMAQISTGRTGAGD